MSFSPPLFDVPKPVIGMLHLPALPGSPRYSGDVRGIRHELLRDAGALASAGVHGLMIENFNDAPFFPGRVPPYVATHMTALAMAVREKCELPLGINVLRNDGQTALAIAHAVGAAFIRVNVLSGARVADQGLLQGIAHELLRDRRTLGAEGIRIFADVDVKHSATLAERPLVDEVDDTIERGLADGLVVSGLATGKPTELAKLKVVTGAAAGRTPVFIGSGITAENVADYLDHADGFIIGTTFKVDGIAHNPIDPFRVEALLERLG